MYFDLGYPEQFGGTHIGFYQPVLRRFLLTMCDHAQAQRLRMLISSRYNVYICDLTTADNYAPNMIDNHCCENWDLTNSRDLFLPQPFDNDCVTAVASLRPAPGGESEFIAQEKQYLHTAWHYLKFAQHVRRPWDAASLLVSDMFGIEHLDPGLDLVRQIERCIYFQHDAPALDQACSRLIADSPQAHGYRSWLQK